MSKLGSFLRSNAPFVYFPIVGLINWWNKFREPYMIYITDSLGGSFKTYINNNSVENLVHELVKGMDHESKVVVKKVVDRFMYYPDEQHKKSISKKEPIYGGLLELEEESAKSEIKAYLKKMSSNHRVSMDSYDASVFYFYHGLKLMPEEVLDYIEGEDFMDIGAYIGDSAIALSSYNYRKIYSVEISLNSIKKYRKNLAAAGIANAKYQIFQLAISDNDNLPKMQLPDTGSAGFSLMRKRGKYDYIEIEQKSFDKLVDENKIKPKFIKVDIEGYAMHFVKGALKSLNKFRPVLSIAIYHNPIEFFEIAPLLEKELTNYHFMIRKLTPDTSKNLCHSEVILLGYPKELMPH